MQSDQLNSFLTLYHVFGLGRVSLERLSEQFGNNFNHIVDASNSQLQAAGLSSEQITQIKNPDLEQLETELQWAEQPGNHLI